MSNNLDRLKDNSTYLPARAECEGHPAERARGDSHPGYAAP